MIKTEVKIYGNINKLIDQINIMSLGKTFEFGVKIFYLGFVLLLLAKIGLYIF